MRVLVTGAGGFIGSVLVPMLLDRGEQVIAIDDFRHGVPSLAGCAENQRLKIIVGDCRDIASIAKNQFDFVFHLAAIVGVKACDRDPGLAESINVGAVRGLLRCYQGPIVMPCTNSGYGVGGEEKCTEDSPLKPQSLYARLKLQAEREILQSGGVSLRLATCFGMSPRMRFDLLVNDFVRRAVRDKALTLFEAHFRRNYLHVRDAARAMIFASDNFSKMKGRPWNVGDDRANMTKAQLCEEIQKQVPDFVFTTAKIGEDPDKRDYVVSSQRIYDLGFHVGWSLEDGIRELIQGCGMYHGEKRWRNS